MMNLHTKAVDGAIAAARGLTAADDPLLELARTLARQMDAAGPEGPGTRLAGAYLTTVRTLMARIGPGIDADRPQSTLAKLRAERGLEGPRTKRRSAS